MQYLLTEEEYEKLQLAAKIGREAPSKDLLQEFCTTVADKLPVVKKWNHKEGDPLEPWGCILSRKSEYCDACPAIIICPNRNKEYSK